MKYCPKGSMKYFIVEIDFGFENPYICIKELLILTTMVYLKIKENTQQAKAFIELAKTMNFIEFVEMDKKNKLLSEIEAGLKEVKLMQEGKLPKKTLKQMLNGK